MTTGLSEGTFHSFIIRLWLEETATESDEATWRGRIIHVPTNTRYYVMSLEGINDFIASYLKEMGVQLNDS